MKKDMKYDEALRELESLVAKIEDPETNLAGLAADVKKAMDLVKWCKASLRDDREALDALLKEE